MPNLSYRRQAHLVVLASNCTEENYVKLVEALCTEHGIHLLKACALHSSSMTLLIRSSQVDDNKQLGEWAGLCKIDKDGTARKVVGCSAVAITVSRLGLFSAVVRALSCRTTEWREVPSMLSSTTSRTTKLHFLSFQNMNSSEH